MRVRILDFKDRTTTTIVGSVEEVTTHLATHWPKVYRLNLVEDPPVIPYGRRVKVHDDDWAKVHIGVTRFGVVEGNYAQRYQFHIDYPHVTSIDTQG
jgi:hypothetical protein